MGADLGTVAPAPDQASAGGDGRAAAGPWAVEADSLTVSFGPVRALRGVSLRLAAGERLAVFGANGAGKTTLLRVLATLLAPTGGTLRLLGLDPRSAPREVRRRIGVVGHETYLDADLTAAENLAFYARLYDVPRAAARVGEVLELVGLTARARDRVGTLSRGMRQRLALARALLHRPELLLLDEPDTGLDTDGLDALDAALGPASGQPSVVLTSHHPERAARLAPRALRLAGGRLVAEGPTLAVGAGAAAAPPLATVGAER